MGKLSIDSDVIRELASLLDETNLSEIEWEEADKRVRVSRGGTQVVAAAPAASAPVAQSAAPAPAPTTSEDAGSNPGAVKSPMVGTVYLSPEPGAAAFAKEGDRVAQGQTLLIVEAMKTMNPIAAPRAGVVSKVLVDDATPVEFGQPLMIVE